jgi:heptosyltransferase-2
MVGHYLALAQVDAPAHLGPAGAGDWASSVLGATSFQPGAGQDSAMGLRAPRVDPRPRLQRSPAQMKATLHSLGLEAQAYVVMVPGAEYGPAKRWPATHFSALARSLGLPTVLMGSAKEAALCEGIAAPVNAEQAQQVRNLAGQTDLLTAMDVMASARAVVSNDSGLMHVAAAFGVAQVALFGSSSPEHTPPLNPQAQVLWLARDDNYTPALNCAPCFERQCPLGHTRCLNDISPERVRQALGM